MSTRQQTVDFILDQMDGAGSVVARKMFGEYGVYCDGKLVALVCDDQLFIKPTAAGRAYAGDLDEAPPYPGAKPSLLIPGERLEDRAWLTELARITTAALPPPIAPKRRSRKSSPA